MSNQKMKSTLVNHVKINEASFWADRMKVIEEVAIPYQWEALNDRVPNAERSHSIENFRIVSGETEGKYYGRVFQDSDAYKWLEAASYHLQAKHDPQLVEIADYLIDLIAKSQHDDGYINTYFTLEEPGKRWTNLRDQHELYCGGHMIEAAVAYYQATGKRKLLDVACRFADHVASMFGTEEGKKRGYPGHEEIELALVKLYKVTGEKRYLDLSQYFIEERGRQPHYFEQEAKERKEVTKRFENPYYQAHLPVKEQKDADGHAVRAMYLYSGMVDVAAETGDQQLLEACKNLWKSVVEKRMYITGAIGSTFVGEAFTFDYDLPNDIAYAETCAAIGLIFWAQRMLLAEADSEYADVMERALYNGVLSGISLDGTKYFYVNPLEVWPEACEKRNDRTPRLKTTRQEWWGTACCPPNIARLVTSLGQYLYSFNDESIYVHLYADNEANFQLKGNNVSIQQKTKYPWEGTIGIEVNPEEAGEFSLALRIPGWCNGAQLKINGDSVDLNAITTKGYATIRRVWSKGDQVELTLSMPVQRIKANPHVRANAGRAALQRGPIVYCLEEIDNESNLLDITLPRDTEFSVHYDSELLNGVAVIETQALRSEEAAWSHTLYGPADYKTRNVQIKAVPYFAWCNRTPGEMLVWIREN